MNDEVDLPDRNDWRNWLAQNHSEKDHVWLTVRKKNSSNNGVNLEEAVEEAICFGWIDGNCENSMTRDFF